MPGPAKPRRLDQPIAVSLEDLVPANDFYRHLEAELDLSFVREWSQELYAERGRPARRGGRPTGVMQPPLFFLEEVGA
jgi:hypothetical protein